MTTNCNKIKTFEIESQIGRMQIDSSENINNFLATLEDLNFFVLKKKKIWHWSLHKYFRMDI